MSLNPSLSPATQAELAALLADGRRKLLGLAGAPGSGKSTLAQAIAAALPGQAQVVPMDGFHLAQAELERLGRAGRKGAPDTFDAAGFVALLRRLRAQAPGDPAVYAPAFRRELEEPIAGAIAVASDTRLLITEGNYLLLDEGPWAEVAPLLDACWYVEVDETRRLEWLVQRHVQFGRNRSEALAWVATSDEPNARRIEATRTRAQRVLRAQD